MRKIRHLISAEQLSGWPDGIPHPRPRGAKAYGKRYEKAIADSLKYTAIHGCWWQFRDHFGPGVCQTDFVLIGKTFAVVLEAKHTWTHDAIDQLQCLYLPIVRRALRLPTIGIQICKNLTPDVIGRVYNDLDSAVDGAWQNEHICTLHWIGVLPLITKETYKWLDTTQAVTVAPTPKKSRQRGTISLPVAPSGRPRLVQL